jgi:hypothetical protein
MLEICISGFLVVSVAVSIILWRALATAKRADHAIQGIDNMYILETVEEKVNLTEPIPSGGD